MEVFGTMHTEILSTTHHVPMEHTCQKVHFRAQNNWFSFSTVLITFGYGCCLACLDLALSSADFAVCADWIITLARSSPSWRTP